MKKTFSNILVFIVLVAISAQSFGPAFALGDLEKVDWGQEIILLSDLNEYLDEKERLEDQGKFDEAMQLKPKKQLMSDKKVLDYFKIPEDQSDVIKNLATKKTPEEDQFTAENLDFLQPKPREVQLQNGVPYSQKDVIPEVKIEGVVIPAEPTKSISKKTGAVFPTVYADELIETPLITIEEAFNKGLVPGGLYFLTQAQNSDGSFGKSNIYETTSNVVDLLEKLKRTDNDNYRLALSYLIDAEPKNNLEKSIKARVLFAQNQPYQALLDEVVADMDSQTGGVGVNSYYQSDLLTTLETAKSLYVCNYSFNDALPSLLSYIIDQINDDGAVLYTEDSDPSFYLTNKTAQTLANFRGYNLEKGNGQISIREKIDLMLSFLVGNHDSTELSDNLMLLNSLQLNSANEEIQKTLSEELKGYQYFDGSFNGSVYLTTIALATLSQPDLVLAQLLPTTNLRNKDLAGFDVVVRNDGFRKADEGIVYIFVDDFRIDHQLNLAQAGLAIEPGESKLVHINFPDTSTFIGDTKIEFYLEDQGDLDFDDNWIGDHFNFASASDGSPALPGYYVAHNREVSDYNLNGIFLGTHPGINVRWPRKDDANRQDYLLMFREKGTQDWTFVAYDNALTGGWWYQGFVEGKVYEVTAGVIHQDGRTFTYYSQFTDVQIGMDNQYTAIANGYISDNDEPAGNVHYQAFDSSGSSDWSGKIADPQVPNGTNVFYADEEQYEPLINWNIFRPNEVNDSLRIFTRLKPDNQAPTIDSFEIRGQEDYIINNQNEAKLLAFASDNVSLRSADFYYFDPNEDGWEYLGREAVQNYAAQFAWYVPKELLGAGYKVKAIFHDYRGNVSEPTEWGPFEIRDGTPPDFGMIAPNGGEVWELGSEQTIRWEVDSVNGVDMVDLKLVYPNGDALIKNNIANTGSYNWKIPTNYTFSGEDFKVRVLGTDNGGGEEFFDDSDETFKIIDAGESPALPWDRPMVTSSGDNHALQNCTVESFDLDYDSLGVPNLIYLCSKDTLAADGTITITDNIYHSQKNGADWGDAQLIYQRSTPTDADLNGYKAIRRLKYMIDNNNQSHLIWQESLFGCNENLQEIYYMNTANGVWSQKQNVSGNNTYSFMPDFDVAGDGSVHAVWLDGQSYANCNTADARSVFYKKRQDGQWVNMPGVSDDGYSEKPEIAIDNAGKPNLLYVAGLAGQLRHHKFENNQWSAAMLMQNSYPYAADFISGLQPGELHYVFSEQAEQGAKVMYKHFDGAQWSEVQQISPNVAQHSYTDPQITTDNEGNLTGVFSDYNGLLNRTDIIWASKAQNENWRVLPSIMLASQDVNGTGDSIVSASFDKQLIVGWKGYYERSPEVIFNHADLTNWFVPQPPADPDPEVVDLDPDFQNLIVDGSMEADNVTNWVKWGTPLSYVKSIQEAYNGDQSIYLQVANPGNAGIQQLSIPVEAGKTYKYSFRYKLISGVLESDLCVYKNNSDYENKRIIKNVVSNDWQLVEREFTVPADLGTKRFSAVIRIRNGEGYIDDVVVQPIENIVIDGDMELDNMINWVKWGLPLIYEKTVAQFFGGNRSIHLQVGNQGNAGIQQLSIPVEAGKTYKYSFRYKLISGTLESDLCVYKNNSDFENKRIIKKVVSNDWQLVEREFTVPADLGAKRFSAVIRIRNGEGYIDDVAIHSL